MNNLVLYLIIINLISLFVMGLDKYRAKHGMWRIRERTLFLLAIVGGSVGSILGMYFFRHKTKHVKFVFGFWFIFLIQCVLYYFYSKGTF
ncbi:DUF1294 domain-containing protein [Gottfriedia endophytica]|uniref:DUF1294 domain-containing protein n=1 Tax=Gottfriedia endophytica TaxID=2820819 RepID=UPI002AC35B67|nr:DUF1294 domain-containing protein [Gottfriedia endophytica]